MGGCICDCTCADFKLWSLLTSYHAAGTALPCNRCAYARCDVFLLHTAFSNSFLPVYGYRIVAFISEFTFVRARCDLRRLIVCLLGGGNFIPHSFLQSRAGDPHRRCSSDVSLLVNTLLFHPWHA